MAKQLKISDFEIVDAELIPKPVARAKVNWETFFKNVPKGKAIVVLKTQISPTTVRSALKRFQDKGQFKNLYSTTRKVEGKAVTYVVNPSEEPESEE